jgi:hypothetical protein
MLKLDNADDLAAAPIGDLARRRPAIMTQRDRCSRASVLIAAREPTGASGMCDVHVSHSSAQLAGQLAVHEVASEVSPAARVVQAHHDPVVVTHDHALLTVYDLSIMV